MKLKIEDIQYIANLARLELTKAEEKKIWRTIVRCFRLC